MKIGGNDLLSQIENENNKLGVYLRRYIVPAIQSRGRAGQILATPPDAAGSVELQHVSTVFSQHNPANSEYVGTDATGQIIPAPTPVTGGNVDGPASAVDLDFAQFDGTTGKLIKDGGLSLTTDGTLGADSDALIPSEKAVKTYVDAHAGTGTVTSVALTVPARQTVTGSPVTTAGTLAVTDNNQSANLVFAGPSSGAATAPTFRAIAEADLPASSQVGVFGATIVAGDVTKPQLVTVPYNCTITSWTIIADTAGTVSVEVWFLAGTAPPTAPSIPTVTQKISASAPIALTSAQSAAGGATQVSTWTKPLTQWGTLAFNMTSITTSTKVTIQIQVTRS